MKNVTVKLEESLIKEARHRAVDRGQSLSGWLADLIEREVSTQPAHGAKGASPLRLLDALGDEGLASIPLDIPKLTDEPEGALLLEE